MKNVTFENGQRITLRILSSDNIRNIFAMALFFILFSTITLAQSWQQLGPGAGGQERAIYLHKNVAGNSVLYVGSDVSGIWRSKAINFNDRNNPEQYNYDYISNHRIFRFVNKFYRPVTYDSDYLFSLSRSGIDRINLYDESVPMKQVELVSTGVNFDESWVSDIYIGPEFNGSHKVYFTTGNTRVNDATPKNHKDLSIPIHDFYTGELNNSENEIVNITSFQLPFYSTTYKDVFCLYTDEGADLLDPTDDLVYIGSDGGLFVYNLTPGIINPITFSPAPPTLKITSIQQFDQNTLLITIHGSGIFKYDRTSNQLTQLITDQILQDGSATDIYPPPVGVDNSLDFTQLFCIKVSGNIQGYLAVNEVPKIKSGTYQGEFIGLFYSNANLQNLPDGIWTALNIIDPSNDWGWNQGSPPCANINGATITENNELYIGKQGNIFKSEIPVTGSNNYVWQQIYTSKTANYDPPCTESAYRHRGYVNTALTGIFPQTSNKIWDTQYDRLMWYDNGSLKSFIQVKPQNIAPCYNYGTLTPCTGTSGAISDAFFVKEFSNELYAGVAEGFAGTQGNGYLLKNVPAINNDWTQLHASICGDPLDYFNIGGVDYLYAKPSGSNNNIIYFWDGSAWVENTGWPWLGFHVRAVKMISVGALNYYVVLASSGGGNQTVYILEGDLNTGGNLICSHTNNTGDYILEKIEILLYNLANHPFKVLIGASPVNPVVPTTTYLYELDVDVLSLSCSFSDVADNTGSFEDLNLDLIDNVDEGVTAINVNHDRNIIYAATVRNDTNDPVPVRSHLYQTSFDPATGVINPNWTDISGNMPNKAITYLTSRNSTDNCNEQYVYGVLRGLGSWKFEENPISIITSGGTVCSSSTTAIATVNDPFGGGSTYLWNTGATTSTLPGIGAGTYTVTVTSAGGTCTSTNYVTITEDPYCCNTFVDYIDQTDFNGTTITGEVNLNENVVCSGVVYLDGATVSIKEGISITVSAGSELHVFNSELFSCGNMWIGIIVENGGQLFVHDSEIRDAQYGSYVGPDGNLVLRNSTYDHNVVGVRVIDLGGGSVIIDGTTFSCNGCLGSNPLKKGFDGQWPAPNVVSYAGIEASNSIFNIGVSGSAANHFKDCTRGVSLENCFNTVINNTFSDITSGVYYLPLGGFGIHSEMSGGGILRQAGFGEFSFSPVSFDNCPVAVYAKGGAVSVITNHMTNVGRGIRIDKVKGQNINASNNLIEASDKGILLNNNEDAIFVDVNYNNIFINGNSAAGISAYESVPPAASRKFTINCNLVSVDDGIDGILINSADRINLAQNNILLNSATNSANGIRIQGSSNCDLLENTVTGNNTTRHIAYGTYVSPSNTFTNNHANLTELGFDFGNNCVTDELFRGNTFGEHNIGLHLDGSGIIGVQTNRGNKWYGPFGLWGGQNENVNPNEVVFNPITVHEPNPGSLYHPINDVPVGAQWIFWDPIGIPWSGSFPNPCNSYLAGGGDDNENKYTYTDTLIVNDSINAVQFEEELKYFTSRKLLEKLIINDSLRNDDGIFEQFYDINDGTAAGDLSAAKILIQADIPYQAIESTFGVLIDLLDSLLILDSLVLSDSSFLGLHQSHVTLLLQAITSLNDHIYNYSIAKDSIKSTAEIINNGIIPLNDIELYEKQVNDFYFTFRDSSVFQINQTSLENITIIASLCPYAYGESVYRARSELMRYGIESSYDDKSNCAQLGYLRLSQQQASPFVFSENGIFIYPNPVKNELYFNVYGKTELTEVVIQDVSGRIVLSSKLPSNLIRSNLDVSLLNPGIYSVSVRGSNDFQHSFKVTIIR